MSLSPSTQDGNSERGEDAYTTRRLYIPCLFDVAYNAVNICRNFMQTKQNVSSIENEEQYLGQYDELELSNEGIFLKFSFSRTLNSKL